VFRFPVISGEEMPPAEKPEKGSSVTMSSGEWLQASRSVAFAASSEVVRMSLNGLFLSAVDGVSRMVATDGRRLAMVTQDVRAEFTHQIIIPSNAVSLIDGLADRGDELSLEFDDSHIVARCGASTVTSKLIDQNYPNYRQVIP